MMMRAVFLSVTLRQSPPTRAQMERGMQMVSSLQGRVHGHGVRVGDLEEQVDQVSTTLSERELDIEDLQVRLARTDAGLQDAVLRYEQQIEEQRKTIASQAGQLISHLARRLRKDSAVDVGILLFSAALLQSAPAQWLLRIVRLLLRAPPSRRWRSRVVPLAIQILKLGLFFLLARTMRVGAGRIGIHTTAGTGGESGARLRDLFNVICHQGASLVSSMQRAERVCEGRRGGGAPVYVVRLGCIADVRICWVY